VSTLFYRDICFLTKEHFFEDCPAIPFVGKQEVRQFRVQLAASLAAQPPEPINNPVAKFIPGFALAAVTILQFTSTTGAG
jgi:hypothetical protein